MHVRLLIVFQYRGMWERYCRGVEVIVFVVDANDPKLFPLAQKEMQALLAQPTLVGVPLLVLLNKNDLPTAIDPEQVVKELYDDRNTAGGRKQKRTPAPYLAVTLKRSLRL